MEPNKQAIRYQRAFERLFKQASSPFQAEITAAKGTEALPSRDVVRFLREVIELAEGEKKF